MGGQKTLSDFTYVILLQQLSAILFALKFMAKKRTSKSGAINARFLSKGLKEDLRQRTRKFGINRVYMDQISTVTIFERFELQSIARTVVI